MNTEYLSILLDHLYFIWIVLLIPIAALIIAMIISLAKRKWKFNKIVLWDGVLMALLLIMGMIHTIPIAIDISQNSIENEQYGYAYYYNQDENNGLFKRAILFETVDGSKICLNDTTDDFPYEIENGTVTYAKHSKIILEYTGTVINQDHF